MKQRYKIFIYAGAVLVIGLILYFVWTVFVPKPTIPLNNSNTGTLPVGGSTTGATSSEGGEMSSSTTSLPVLSKISNNDVLAYLIDPQSGDVRYIDPTGQVWLTNPGKSDTLESSQPVSAINSLDIYQNNQKILVSFGNPTAPQWAIYDVLDKTWHSLPSSVTEATWGANQNQLIGITKNVNSYSLSYIDLSKNPPAYKTILNNFYMSDINMKFSSPNTLIITEKPSALYKSSVWEINLKNNSMNMVFEPASGLYAGLSEDGSLIYSYSSGMFSIVNSSTLVPYTLPFVSLPDKCDLSANSSSSNVYCFSPENITPQVTTPDDYLEKAFYSIDLLYNYNFANQNTKTIIISGTPGIPMIDAREVNLKNGNIYFVNRYDKSLYKLSLPSQ